MHDRRAGGEPTCDRGENETGGRSSKIRDDSAQPGGGREPTEHGGDLVGFQVMQKETAEGDVDGRERISDRIEVMGSDLEAAGPASITAPGQGVFADIHRMPLDLDPTGSQPAAQTPHEISAAGREVENRQRSRRIRSPGIQCEDRCSEGPVGERPGIEPGETIERRIMVGLGERGVVHQFWLEMTFSK